MLRDNEKHIGSKENKTLYDASLRFFPVRKSAEVPVPESSGGQY